MVGYILSRKLYKSQLSFIFMEVKLCAVGGYSECGKNMTAIKVGDEAIILDMGVYLPKVIDFEEEGGDRNLLNRDSLIKMGAVPDDNIINSWRDKVKAIIPSHCHLDHTAAIPYLAGRYNAPIIGTPFTLEVIKDIIKDGNLNIRNKFKSLNPGSTIKISKNFEIEFINSTHSTLQTAMVAVHTPAGIILYTNDFKFDNHPIIGKGPDYNRLKKLGKSGNVLAVIMDSLYSNYNRKTPSESVAKEMLKDVLLGTDNEGHAIIATTFASHLARLKSIIEFGKKLDRKIVFMGRSMFRYTTAAEKLNLVNFTKEAEICKYANNIKRKLKQIEKEGRDRYLIVCTGNQGEPRSTLVRMANGELPFNFKDEDHIIFSCKTIPTPETIKNRDELEHELKRQQVRIFKDIHVSGHASLEDHRDVLTLLKPEHIIPSHGPYEIVKGMEELGIAMGYKKGKTLHVMKNFEVVRI